MLCKGSIPITFEKVSRPMESFIDIMRKVINIRHHHRFLNGLILEVQVMTVFISLKRIESVCTLRSSHILRVVINTVFHTARSHHVPLMLAQRTSIIRDGLICFVSDAYISTPL